MDGLGLATKTLRYWQAKILTSGSGVNKDEDNKNRWFENT